VSLQILPAFGFPRGAYPRFSSTRNIFRVQPGSKLRVCFWSAFDCLICNARVSQRAKERIQSKTKHDQQKTPVPPEKTKLK